MAARILNSPDFKTPNFLTDLNQSVGEYLWKILQQSKNRECLVNMSCRKTVILFYNKLIKLNHEFYYHSLKNIIYV